jgi:hypothetical protein
MLSVSIFIYLHKIGINAQKMLPAVNITSATGLTSVDQKTRECIQCKQRERVQNNSDVSRNQTGVEEKI